MTRVLVIGADAAGMSAAHQALRSAKRHGRSLEIVAVDAGAWSSYSACGIPYVASGEVANPEQLIARTPEQHRAAGIDLRMRTRVTHVDLEARTATVEVADEDGTWALGEPIEFDELVVASGARPATPPWALDAEGQLLAGVRHAKTVDDAGAWAQALGEPGQRVLVVGGGFIGVEMAEAARRRGHDVVLAARSRVLSTFAAETTERIAAAMRDGGVDVREYTEVAGLDAVDGRVRCADLGTGTEPFDHVVLAIGVAPATEFLAHTDLLTGARGALRPDLSGRVAEGVWAAGDCTEVRANSGHWTYAPLGTHANKVGRVLGENLGGGSMTYLPVLGTSITRFATEGVHLEIARTGILDKQLAMTDWDAFSLTTEGTTASGYMPEASPIAIRVTADRSTRRLLSVEIVGGPGAGKRIDTAAAVLQYRGTVDDLAWMDLSYAPPVATGWEMLQIAARRVAERL